jgi:hypothetical protein
MIYEFALEPSVLYAAAKNKRNYIDFIKLFSIGAPRVISNFPRFQKIKKEILSNLPAEPWGQEQQRLIEIIQFLQDLNRVQRSFSYDGNYDWKTNVITENGRVAFDHILTLEHDPDLDSVTLETLFEVQSTYPTQLLVDRAADAMAHAIGNMLRLSTRIVFVDPYFGSNSSKWKPFIRFIEQALANRPTEKLSIEVVYGFDKKSAHPAQVLFNKLRDEHSDILKCCAVSFKGVREKKEGEKLHNRYVLSNIGGVSFGVGLDEGDENEQDDVVLLNEDLFSCRWEQYATLNAFDLAEQSQA